MNNASNGFLCVTHNPSCGNSGNHNCDKFFNADIRLALLCTIVGCDFEQFWPVGITSSGGGGSLVGRIIRANVKLIAKVNQRLLSLILPNHKKSLRK
jgi:hypothetical protein